MQYKFSLVIGGNENMCIHEELDCRFLQLRSGNVEAGYLMLALLNCSETFFSLFLFYGQSPGVCITPFHGVKHLKYCTHPLWRMHLPCMKTYRDERWMCYHRNQVLDGCLKIFQLWSGHVHVADLETQSELQILETDVAASVQIRLLRMSLVLFF